MGLIKFLFSNDYKHRSQRDQYKPHVMAKNIISPINDYGTCFSCNGTGSKTLTCRSCNGTGSHTGTCNKCHGSGRIHLKAKPCFNCDGIGYKHGRVCKRCGGSGEFKPATTVVCNKCSGTGRFYSSCRKCSGLGSFTVTCRKCGGSGWHRF